MVIPGRIRAPCADPSPKKDTVSKQLQTNKTFKKTSQCRFFASGACLRGENCNFAHGTEEVRTKPNLVNLRFCADFIEVGSCKKGLNCNFAHSISEFRGKVKSSSAKPAAAKLPSGSQSAQWAAMSLKAHSMLAEVLLPVAAHGVTYKEYEEQEKLEEHDEEEEGDRVLNGDLMRTGQWPMHSQPDYQLVSDYKVSHLDESRVLTVKNTFIHVLDEDPLLGLRKSSSSPLLAQHPLM